MTTPVEDPAVPTPAASQTSRKMLQFIGLDWDPQCLQFQSNQRLVVTASAWQVRQKIYKTSVARWRHYAEFIGPLKKLGT